MRTVKSIVHLVLYHYNLHVDELTRCGDVTIQCSDVTIQCVDVTYSVVTSQYSVVTSQCSAVTLRYSVVTSARDVRLPVWQTLPAYPATQRHSLYPTHVPPL